MTTTPQPPTARQLDAVLGAHAFFSDAPAVASFLASPVTSVPGVGAGVWQATLWMRDFTAPVADLAGDLARAATGLAMAAHVAGDRYLDLTAGPDSWSKTLRSGHRRVAFGPDLLWGSPKISLEDGVAVSRVDDFVAAWRTGELTEFPTVVTGRHPVLVDGTRRRVVLRSMTTPAPAPALVWAPPGVEHAQASGADIARRLGGAVVSVQVAPDREPGEEPGRAWARVEVEVGARRVVVPFSFAPGGYQLDDVRAGVAAGPDGFTAAGPALVHAASGIVCHPA